MATVVLGGSLVAAACNGIVATPPPPQTVTAPINFETDSIGFQFGLASGFASWPGAHTSTWMGATMGQCPYAGCVPANVDLDTLKKNGNARRNFIELATNDTAGSTGGWTTDDENTWAAVLFNMPSDSCTVVAMPWVTDPQPQAWKDQVDAARVWMAQADAMLPQVVTIDWRDYALRPGVLGPDGVHLSGPDGMPFDSTKQLAPEAVSAYHDMIVDGLAKCDQGG